MAMTTKSKGPASDSIMTPDKMKPLLALSKKEPVQAAIGLTADGEGLLLLDKRAKPKKVLSMLRADAGKAKLQLNAASLRFGRAEVDPDYDGSMVRFFVNKETPGVMRVKLIEVVKRVPYQKVEINVDPSLEEEPEEDVQAQETASTDDASTPEVPPPPPPPDNTLDGGALTRELAALAHRIPGADQSLKPRLLELANDANTGIKANNLTQTAQSLAELRTALDAGGQGGVPPPPPLPQMDANALIHQLAPLARRIPEVGGTDANLRATLAKLATDAGTAIKATNLTEAAELIARLRQALDNAPPGQTQGTGPGGTADVRAIWRDAKDSVDEGLNKLAAELRSYEDPDLERIADFGLFGIGTGENVALNKALIEYSGAAPNRRQYAAGKLKIAIGNYRALLQKEPMVGLIDTNPVVPMQMRATIDGALTQIEQALA
jgi:hypothetical protein